jgi:transcriptional regulator with XRE-family HTH domain
MAKAKKSKAMRALEAATGGSLTFGEMIWAIREGEEMSLAAFGKQLGVSAQQLHDIEKGRRSVSVERAHKWALVLGYHPRQFVELALQQQLEAAGLPEVRVELTGWRKTA